MRSNGVAVASRAALGAALLLWAAAGAGAAERLLVGADDSPVLGPAQAPVTVVEFVDYQ